MLTLSSKMQNIIEKTCKGKTHIKLTVGAFAEGEKTIQTFGETGEIPNENYVYEIGSNTKTILASLLAKYVHEGKMALDDSISKYIDGLDSSAYYPTLKRLVTHTAGYAPHLEIGLWTGIRLLFDMMFRSSANKGFLPFKVDEAKMKRLLLENKMKDKDYPWHYSNFSYALLGHAIGAVSGRGYWDTMDDYLTNDLKMINSCTGKRAVKKLHGFDKKNRDIGNWNWGNDVIAPAGDVFSTADDMLTYARINAYDEMPYLSLCHKKYADLSKRLAGKFDMGLGWPLDKNNHNILVGSGGTGAFHSILIVDKQKKRACVVLANYHIDLLNFMDTVLEDLKKS